MRSCARDLDSAQGQCGGQRPDWLSICCKSQGTPIYAHILVPIDGSGVADEAITQDVSTLVFANEWVDDVMRS